MLLCVALCLALITPSCCAGEELTTDEYPTVTLTSDYEYDYATFDYSNYPGPETYIPNKASGTGQLNLVFLLGLVLHQIWT